MSTYCENIRKRLLFAMIMMFITSCGIVPGSMSASETPPSNPKVPQTPTLNSFLNPPPTATVFSKPTQTQTPIAETPTAVEWTPVPTMTLRANTPLSAGESLQITSIKMIDPQHGWGFDSDGHILRTQNGGRVWQDVTPPRGNYYPAGFFALNAETAWATFQLYEPGLVPATAYVWRTDDSGKTWISSQPFHLDLDPFGNPYPAAIYYPVAMQFVNNQTGWLLADVAYGMNSARPLFFQTTDGGATWTTINDRIGFPGTCVEVGFAFIDAQTGWAGGNCFAQGVISNSIKYFLLPSGWMVSKTIDGGHSYEPNTAMPMPAEFQGTDLLEKEGNCGERRIMSIAANAIGIEWGCSIFTSMRPDYTYFALSTDGGQTWNSWKSSGNEFFLDARQGWRLLSPGQLQQSRNGGLNWTTIKTVAWENAQFDFVTDQIGWGVVTAENTTAFIQTTDGGITWTEIKPLIAP